MNANKLSMDYEATNYHYERFHINDHVDQRARGLIDIFDRLRIIEIATRGDRW